MYKAAKIVLLSLLSSTTSIAQSFTHKQSTQVSDSRGISITDLDNNSYPDVYISNLSTNRNEFLLNWNDSLIQENSGIGGLTDRSSSSTIGDYNNDCKADILLANGGGGTWGSSQSNNLQRGTGMGGFSTVASNLSSLSSNSTGASWGDFDADGDLDVFIVNTNNQVNRLYRNDLGIFTAITAQSFSTHYRKTTATNWVDYDNDGDLDLFVTNADSDNELYRQDSSGYFTEITSGSLVNDGGWSFGAVWGDYDNDGDQDVFVHNTSAEVNFYYRNQGNGTFQKVTTGPLVTRSGYSVTATNGDFNNDGYLDIAVGNGRTTTGPQDLNLLYINDGSGGFITTNAAPFTSDLRTTTGMASADLDKNGALDIATSSRNEENDFYYNQDTAGNFLSFEIQGLNANKIGLNSKVRLKADLNGDGMSEWQYREVLSSNGGSSQSSPELFFGLGTDTIVDSLVIDWLGGGQCVFTNLQANAFLHIKEDMCSIDTLIDAAFSDTSHYLNAEFKNASLGPVTRYFWDFGDQSVTTDTSNLPNPRYRYNQPGRYKVCLYTFDNFCKWDTTCTILEICPDTSTIGFLNSNVGTRLTFTDTSTSAAYAINWDFGDNTSDSGAVVTHSYSQAGTYQVCLTLTDSCRSKQICRTISVCNDTLIANFGSSGNGYTWTFSDSSLNANTITWDFGDGSTAVGSNPSHTFSAPGSYYVCQTVLDICTSTTFCDTVEVCTDSLNSNFSYSGTGRVLNFSASVSNATSFYWDFGDGDFSTQQNPAHAYLNFGTYTVCLAVSNDCYSDTICQQVVVCNQPGQAAFSTTNTVSPLVIQFNDQSQNAVSYEWDFGDGSISTKKNPLKAFNSADTFNVCLTIVDSCGGQDATCQVVDLTSVGLDENNWLQELKIFPNPTSGTITVENPGIEQAELRLTLRDLQGRNLLSKNYKQAPGQCRLELDPLPKGVYLLQLKSSGMTRSVRIMKN